MNQLYEDALTRKIRSELAKEIHDELGNMLAVISSKIKVAKLKLKNNDELDPEFFDKAEDAADKLLHSTKDFIWTVGSSNNNPVNLFYYLKDIGNELFDHDGVQFYANIVKGNNIPVTLSVQQGYQMVLLFKEALTNTAKHAGATEVHLVLKLSDGKATLVLSDNGQGFDRKVKAINSFGLQNMQYRANRVGGELTVESQPENGTTVTFSLQTARIRTYETPEERLLPRQAS